MIRNAKAVWRGTGRAGSGNLSTDSGVLANTPYSFKTRFENEKGTNPEELIAAAHAGCFTMALAFRLSAAGHPPASLDTGAEVSLTQEGNDIHQLENSLFEIDRNTGKKPAEMVVDSGYISGDNIIKMSGTGIDLYGPMPDNESKGKRKSEMAPEFYSEKFTYDAAANSFTCPAGKSLRYKSQYKTGQFTYYAYLARKSDCQQCPFKSQCCPKTKSTGRTVTRKQILPEVEAFNKKMSTEESKAIYKERSPVAEFPNLWIKEKLGLRRFRVRGLVKAGLELLWAALTYNLQHWIRLSGGKLSPGLS